MPSYEEIDRAAFALWCAEDPWTRNFYRLKAVEQMKSEPRYALARVELIGSTHKTPAGDNLMLARLASRPDMPCFAVGEEDLVGHHHSLSASTISKALSS